MQQSPMQGTTPAAVPEGQDHQLGAGANARMPLVRAMRMRQPDLRRVAALWLERFSKDKHSAMKELVMLVLVIADVPGPPELRPEDMQGNPAQVIEQLVANLAMEASEHGADFTQHWLASREAGATRIRENYYAFWCGLTMVAPCQVLLGGLLAGVWAWMNGFVECQLRSIRHVATVAGLQLVTGLGLQCRALQEFCSTAILQLRDAEVRGVEARRAAVATELESAKGFRHDLGEFRDTLGLTLLGTRTRDVDPLTRQSCFRALHEWVLSEPAVFMDPIWTKHIYNGCSDHFPAVRSTALAALHDLLRSLSTNMEVSRVLLADLQERARAKVLSRCQDKNAEVSAMAVRCATVLAAKGLLAGRDFDPVIDLVWNPDMLRRDEACVFVSRNVFSEDIFDIPTDSKDVVPVNHTSTVISRRRVQMLLQFISEYTEGHFVLTCRLVQSLWRRASCLEDWEAFTALALPGQLEQALTGERHTILIFLMEAVAEVALNDILSGKADAAADYGKVVLSRAARALAPRLPALLAACQAEPVAMRRATALCRHILHFCVLHARGGGGDLLLGVVGDGAPAALKVAFLRQPDPEVLENAADCFSYLLHLRHDAAPTVNELAGSLRDNFLQLADIVLENPPPEEAPTPESILAVAVRLRILSKAMDVSMCDINRFVAVSLQLLDARAGKASTSLVSAELAAVLFELLALLMARHAVAAWQPTAFLELVRHDQVNYDELNMLPTVVADFGHVVVATMLGADEVQHVRTAAFTSSLLLLTALWRCYAGAQGDGDAKQSKEPLKLLSASPEVMNCLRECLGQILLAANAVPNGSGQQIAQSSGNESSKDESGPSAFSKAFAVVSRILSKGSAAVVTDAEQVQLAVLACKMVIGCQHPAVATSPLIAIVLSQALSPREDLQEQAWALLRELRRSSRAHSEQNEAFFTCLVSAVCSIHRDVGIEVARDLSSRLLLHVAVGKLSRALQKGYIAAVTLAVKEAFADDASAGLLEVIVPWVTKRLVDSQHIEALAKTAEEQANASQKEGAAEHAGLAQFLQACYDTAARERTMPAGVQGVETAESQSRRGQQPALPPAEEILGACGSHVSTPASNRSARHRRRAAQLGGGSSRKRQKVSGICPQTLAVRG